MNDFEFMDSLDVFILHITTELRSKTTCDKLNEKLLEKKRRDHKLQSIRLSEWFLNGDP